MLSTLIEVRLNKVLLFESNQTLPVVSDPACRATSRQAFAGTYYQKSGAALLKI